jgi:ABC-type branched-subunit amino acid transport system ATPase component
VRQALSIADRVDVMDRGSVTLSGAVEDTRGRLAEIEAAYLPDAT